MKMGENATTVTNNTTPKSSQTEGMLNDTGVSKESRELSCFGSAVEETLNPPKPAGSFFRVLDLVVTAPGCAEERTEAEIAAFFDNVVVLPLSP